MSVLLKIPFQTYDYVYGDECQDMSRIQQEAIIRAAGANGRIIMVGDPSQCQPAGTLVTLEGGKQIPIENLRKGMSVVSYDRHSSAFVGRVNQGRPVNRVACRLYEGQIYRISAGSKATFCTPTHKWLVRFSERSTDLWATYLMKRGDSYRVGWCQLFDKSGAFHLGQRTRLEKADAAWILQVFDNKRDASFEEIHVSLEYQIPQVMFQEAENNYLYDQSSLNRFWKSQGDLTAKARNALAAYGREIDFPIYTASTERKGRTTIFETQACNLIAGVMSVPLYNGERDPIWTPLEISREEFCGSVYSLDIDTHHKYVADGILTCNSIYGWRGADPDSMRTVVAQLEQTPRGVKHLPLSISWRCPKSHIRLAQLIEPMIQPAPDAPEGEEREITEEQFYSTVKPGDLVMSRVNAPLLGACYALLKRGVRATVRGRQVGNGLASVIRRLKARDINDLMEKIARWESVEGAKLLALGRKGAARYINLQDKVSCLIELTRDAETVDEVLRKIDTLFSEFDDQGQPLDKVVLGTYYRTKGLEAASTFILSPDLMPHPMAKSAKERKQEFNGLFIVLTRAKYERGNVEANPGRLHWVGKRPAVLAAGPVQLELEEAE
jgi:hypothetical protein